MTSYRIRYKIRRRSDEASIGQGEWQDKEVRVVAGEDARKAVAAIYDTTEGHDFCLREIKVIGEVDIIAQTVR